ncbi:MAG: hypothetical protein ACO1OC_11680 [Tuberibacillus sp.]
MKWHSGEGTPVFPFEYDHLFTDPNDDEPSEPNNESKDAEDLEHLYRVDPNYKFYN